VVRTRALAGEELVSQLDLETQEAQLAAVEASADQAEARVDEARATVEERRSAIDKTLVRSPVAGRVGQRNAEIGMLADAGAPLFVVGNLDELMVEIPLTEEMLGFLRPGMPVRLSSPAFGGEPIAARLSRVSPFLAADSFSTIGEIDVANPDGRLRPGMFVTVDVLYGETEEATLVPTSAVWDDPASGRRGLYVVEVNGSAPGSELSEDERAVEFRPVEILAEGRGTAGVRGAEPGEWVVTVGQHLLASQDAEAARVRSVTWERVLELQGLQKEDLLRGFLDKQHRLARDRGAEPPPSREFMNGT
jgi:RND family efflux transporter MFP subunit